MQGQLEGLGGAGFTILTRADIEAAAGEDEELAAQVAAAKEAEPPVPISQDVCAKLLHKLFSEKSPEEPPELAAEGPIGELIQIENGPRSFKVFVNDFPARNDLAAIEASLEVRKRGREREREERKTQKHRQTDR